MKMEVSDKELRIRGKLNFYMDKNIKVHVKRFDGYFWNGYLTGKETEGVFIFEEDKLGRCLLFAIDVREVEEFKEKGYSTGNGGVGL